MGMCGYVWSKVGRVRVTGAAGTHSLEITARSEARQVSVTLTTDYKQVASLVFLHIPTLDNCVL